MPARSLHGRSLSHGVRFSVQTASAGRDPSLRLLCDATAVRSICELPSHGRNTSAGSTTTCVSRRALSEAQNCPPNMAVRLAHPASAASSDSASNAAQSSAPIGLAPAGGRPHRRYIHRPCVNDNSASATPVARAICAIALGKVSWCRAINDVSCRKCATNAVRPPGRGRSSASSWKVSGLDSPAAPADAASKPTRKARSMARATRLESMSRSARACHSLRHAWDDLSDLFQIYLITADSPINHWVYTASTSSSSNSLSTSPSFTSRCSSVTSTSASGIIFSAVSSGFIAYPASPSAFWHCMKFSNSVKIVNPSSPSSRGTTSSPPFSHATSNTASSSPLSQSMVMTPLRSKLKSTDPISATLPPFLLMTLLVSAAARLTLSDRTSMTMPTPPSP